MLEPKEPKNKMLLYTSDWRALPDNAQRTQKLRQANSETTD